MSTVSGAYGVGDPPVPIPNTEVKTHCGNNTRTTRSRKDSTVPDSIQNTKASDTKCRRPLAFYGYKVALVGHSCLTDAFQRGKASVLDKVAGPPLALLR